MEVMEVEAEVAAGRVAGVSEAEPKVVEVSGVVAWVEVAVEAVARVVAARVAVARAADVTEEWGTRDGC